MRSVRLLLFILIISLPAGVVAALSDGDLPAARWYAHVDLVEMRSSEAGRHLYDWLEDEVFEELRDDIGFEADQEADVITALATPEGGMLVVIEGNFSQKTKDRMLAFGAMASDFNTLDYNGNAYYQIEDDDSDDPDSKSFDNQAFMTVAIANKLILASSEEQMHQLIDGKGKIPGSYNNEGALIVLRGEKNFVQAGIGTENIGDDLGWDSNMLRNTEQVALLVSDESGKLAVKAQLIAAKEEMANSLASIVRGLISLQVFNDDIDPELTEILQNTTVDVDGVTLTVKVAMDPEALVDVID